MADSKNFRTYNQQIPKLRNDKHIDCHDSKHKQILVLLKYITQQTDNLIDS